MGKPRAARKQPIVLLSDDDEIGSHSPPPKRSKKETLMRISQNGGSERSQIPGSQIRRASPPKPQSSLLPHKTKSPSKSPGKPKPIYKPITSFFSNVPPPQAIHPTSSPNKPITSTPLEDIDDILDSSGDDGHIAASANFAVRKRGRDGGMLESDGALKGSQKFLRKTDGALNAPPLSQSTPLVQIDSRPWTEKYSPSSVEELAVHKRKVADVRTWLADVFGGTERKRLLLLKGPAGSGKTTTVSLLSQELGFDIQEWKNPSGSNSSPEGFVSATAQFQDFVGRSGAFGSLVFDGPMRTRQNQASPGTEGKHNQLILVEEFPNTFARASSAVQSFRSAILHYLAANTPSATTFFSGQPEPKHSITPVVMIISETLLSTNTAAADSFTAHRLLGPEVLAHPGVTVIEFNAIAPTFMTKALDLVVVKEARKSGRKKTAGPQVLQRLSELGDIRSAVSSLEFLCLRGDDDDGWGGKVTFTKKKGPKNLPLTKMEQESLEMVTQRESTLGIFHAVGRVVHNKRLPEDPNGKRNPQPPNFFPERRRPKVSEVDVDQLIDELGTDTQTFTAALHENYVLSCTGADIEETMDSVEGCVDALSDADLLSPDRFGVTGFGRRPLIFQGVGGDALRQDELSFQVGVRGLLYNLPSPVKRIAPPQNMMRTNGKGQSKGNAFVMYWPTSLRIWKQQEEIGSLLEMWTLRAQRGHILTPQSAPSKPSSAMASGVETWRRRTGPSQAAKSTAKSEEAPHEDMSELGTLVLLGGGGSARYEMLLERLPYLPTILHKGSIPPSSIATSIRDIRKITSFSGTNMNPLAEDHDDEDGDLGEQEQWSTDRPGSPRKKKRNRIDAKVDGPDFALSGIAESDVANLVLSDDDIED